MPSNRFLRPIQGLVPPSENPGSATVDVCTSEVCFRKQINKKIYLMQHDMNSVVKRQLLSPTTVVDPGCPRRSFNPIGVCDNLLLPPATKLGQGNVFTRVCDSVHKVGSWYPSMHCRFPGPHPEGKLRDLARGSPGPHTQGGSPGPHLGGGLQAHTFWGRRLQAHSQRGVSQHALSQTHHGYSCGRCASYWNTFLFIKYCP